MFLEVLRRRNPEFLRAAAGLHIRGVVPANSYVLDLDAITANARALSEEAARHGLMVFAMTKQAGRNPPFCAAVRAGGIAAAVAVDMADARAGAPRTPGLATSATWSRSRCTKRPRPPRSSRASGRYSAMAKAGEAAAAERGRQQGAGTPAQNPRGWRPGSLKRTGGGFPADGILRAAGLC